MEFGFAAEFSVHGLSGVAPIKQSYSFLWPRDDSMCMLCLPLGCGVPSKRGVTGEIRVEKMGQNKRGNSAT